VFFDRIEALHNPSFPVPMRLEKPYLPGEFVFSILTKRLRDFTPLQRVPHTDSGRLASVIYLNLPHQCAGGTAIYQHRETGLVWFPGSNPAAHSPSYAERISDIIDGGAGWRQITDVMSRHGLQTMADVTRFVYRHMNEQEVPIAGTTERWKLLHFVEMKFNRFVMYPGCLFHSGFARDDSFGEALPERRLTQNVFIVWPRL
jgi:hypothetical protein